MAVDELNQAGGLLGRPLELFFYDSQSNNQLNSQYATQALVRDKVQVIHGGITSSSREVMRPIVRKFGGLLFYNSLYEGGVCDRRHVNTGMVPAQQLEPLVHHVVSEEGAKKGYVLAADYHYGQITSKWMQKLLAEAGGEAVAGSSSRWTSPTSPRRSAGSRPRPRTWCGRRWSAARTSPSIVSSRRRSARPT